MGQSLKNPNQVVSSTAELLGENLPFLVATIVESCDDAIISSDLNGLVTTWNPAATRIFGYEPREIIGQSVSCLFPAALRSEEELLLNKLYAGERIQQHETVRVRKDGSHIPVSLTASPIRDATGNVIGALRILRHLSTQRAAEEARLQLAAIVESSDDAIVSKDMNGVVTSWNRAAVRLFGYEPDEIIGQSILTIIPPELHYQEEFILARIRAGERIEHFETERITKSGGRVLVSLTISPVKDELGNVVGASKIARDIAQKKQIELALIESEKLAATGRMAATIAHEINNPLEAVVNLIFLARNESSLPGYVQEYLATAEKEIERVSLIARQTLGFYRDTATPGPLALNDLADDVLAVYQSKFRSRGIKVETEFHSVRPLIGRKGELIQVLSNLVANAIDAMPTGGRLYLRIAECLRADVEGVELTVKDVGVGIKKQDLSRLFEPFFTTKKNVGTGLGLWIVKQFLDNHGGTIAVTSNSEGANRGTTISIFLPFQSRLTIGPDTVPSAATPWVSLAESKRSASSQAMSLRNARVAGS